MLAMQSHWTVSEAEREISVSNWQNLKARPWLLLFMERKKYLGLDSSFKKLVVWANTTKAGCGVVEMGLGKRIQKRQLEKQQPCKLVRISANKDLCQTQCRKD